jgi:hypothetical protein
MILGFQLAFPPWKSLGRFTWEFIAYGLENKDKPDVARYDVEFSPQGNDITCHTVALSQASKESGAFKNSSISLHDHQNALIKTDFLPIFDRQTPEKREVLLFFDRVLKAGTGPYKLRIEDFVVGLLSDLKKQKRDDFFAKLQRSNSPIAQVQIVVHVPPLFNRAFVTSSPKLPTGQVPGRVMTAAELSPFNGPAPNWIKCGWVGNNVVPSESFGPLLCI